MTLDCHVHRVGATAQYPLVAGHRGPNPPFFLCHELGESARTVWSRWAASKIDWSSDLRNDAPIFEDETTARVLLGNCFMLTFAVRLERALGIA